MLLIAKQTNSRSDTSLNALVVLPNVETLWKLALLSVFQIENRKKFMLLLLGFNGQKMRKSWTEVRKEVVYRYFKHQLLEKNNYKYVYTINDL